MQMALFSLSSLEYNLKCLVNAEKNKLLQSIVFPRLQHCEEG